MKELERLGNDRVEEYLSCHLPGAGHHKMETVAAGAFAPTFDISFSRDKASYASTFGRESVDLVIFT